MMTATATDRSASAIPRIHFGVDPSSGETAYRAVSEEGVRHVRQALDDLGT